MQEQQRSPKNGELGIAQLVGMPNVVSFVARVASIDGNTVQASTDCTCRKATPQ